MAKIVITIQDTKDDRIDCRLKYSPRIENTRDLESMTPAQQLAMHFRNYIRRNADVDGDVTE